MRSLLGLLICLPLLGGATCQKREAPPVEIVELPVTKFRGLDEKLTAPCGPKAEGRISEIFEVSKARGIQVDDCDKRMAEIRALQPVIEEKEKP